MQHASRNHRSRRHRARALVADLGYEGALTACWENGWHGVLAALLDSLASAWTRDQGGPAWPRRLVQGVWT